MMRLAVLGHPVAHSRSPMMHNAALRSTGIEGMYRAIDIATTDGMRPMADAVRTGSLAGVNVTMPYKETAFELCDRVTEEARLAGSVNTLFAEDGELWGDSTDVAGVRRSWKARGLPPNTPVLLLGAGGAARAAAIALRDRPITVSARREDRARMLAELPGVTGETRPWGTAVPGAVVVNCTPIGMHGESLPDGVLAEAIGVFDMAYSRGETPAVGIARLAGVPVVDGIDLLAAQAAVSFSRWTGVSAPTGVMEKAARNVSSGPMAEPNLRPTPRQE
jgi:shikimate dehydrogenase